MHLWLLFKLLKTPLFALTFPAFLLVLSLSKHQEKSRVKDVLIYMFNPQ
jgi:hypothetical protein